MFFFLISISLCSRNIHWTHVVMMLSRVRMMMTVMVPLMTVVMTPLKLRLGDILETSAPIINPRQVSMNVKSWRQRCPPLQTWGGSRGGGRRRWWRRGGRWWRWGHRWGLQGHRGHRGQPWCHQPRDVSMSHHDPTRSKVHEALAQGSSGLIIMAIARTKSS